MGSARGEGSKKLLCVLYDHLSLLQLLADGWEPDAPRYNNEEKNMHATHTYMRRCSHQATGTNMKQAVCVCSMPHQTMLHCHGCNNTLVHSNNNNNSR